MHFFNVPTHFRPEHDEKLRAEVVGNMFAAEYEKSRQYESALHELEARHQEKGVRFLRNRRAVNFYSALGLHQSLFVIDFKAPQPTDVELDFGLSAPPERVYCFLNGKPEGYIESHQRYDQPRGYYLYRYRRVQPPLDLGMFATPDTGRNVPAVPKGAVPIESAAVDHPGHYSTLGLAAITIAGLRPESRAVMSKNHRQSRRRVAK